MTNEITTEDLRNNTVNTGKSARMSNIELLRILSMLLIVGAHYAAHGASVSSIKSLSANGFFLQALSLGGKLGVNCFVLITGYFSTGVKEIKWRAVAKLVFDAMFFSLLINGIGMLRGDVEFSVYRLLQYTFPINIKEWWFVSTYFMLLLFIPFLNSAINNISRKLHKQMIVALFIIWVIIGTIDFGTFDSNNLTWFFFLYIVAAYIKKYPSKYFDNQKYVAWTVIASYALMLLSIVALDIVKENRPNLFNDFRYYWDFTQFNNPIFFGGKRTIPMTTLSVSLFCLFKNMRVAYSPRINELAAAMFGVYLIHDSSYGRRYIWTEAFDVKKHLKSPHAIMYGVSIILIVFVSCTVISWLYNLTVKKKFEQLLNKLYKNTKPS